MHESLESARSTTDDKTPMEIVLTDLRLNIDSLADEISELQDQLVSVTVLDRETPNTGKEESVDDFSNSPLVNDIRSQSRRIQHELGRLGRLRNTIDL